MRSRRSPGHSGSAPIRRPARRTRPLGEGHRRPARSVSRRTSPIRCSTSAGRPRSTTVWSYPTPTARTLRSPDRRRTGPSSGARSYVRPGDSETSSSNEDVGHASTPVGRRARTTQKQGVDVLRLDAYEGAGRPVLGHVGREVQHTFGADHDVFGAVATLGPIRPLFIVTVRGNVSATSG